MTAVDPTPTPAYDRFLDALAGKGSHVATRGQGQACAQCPAPEHEDRTASLSVTRAEHGVLVCCHAGCGIDVVLAGLGWARADLFDHPLERRQGYAVIAEYPYTDEAGTILYVKERRFPKDFRQYRPLDGGRRDYRLGDTRRVLYRLPQLQAAVQAGQTVYLCEGEKDAHAVAAAGAAATTWTEGAWKPGTRPKWRPAYTTALTGAHIVVVADDDPPGRHTGTWTATELARVAASVQVVLPLAGKDAADHLAAGHTLDDLKPLPLPEPATGEGEGGSGKGPSQATQLRQLCLDRYRLGVGEDATPFAVLRDGPAIARPFRGGRVGLRAELAKLYAREHGCVPAASALADALTALEGEAAEADPVPLALRVAPHDGGIVLDLGRPDGHAVHVRASGWQVVQTSPVLFRRTAATGAMPDPDPNGTLAPLRDLLNVRAEDWPLVLGWLVAAFLPAIPHPVLVLLGEQGSGKTSATKLLVGCVDASPAPCRMAPADAAAWVVAAMSSWVVGLENVSTIPAWLSDSLCRAVTGDADLRRQLYTDGDLVVFAFRRVLAINGIDLGAIRGDLADRMLTVTLEQIPETARREDETVALSDPQRAQVLAALLDLVAQVLAVLPQIRLERLPRMADFAKVLAALDHLTGSDGLTRYLRQACDLNAAVIDSDPFATAVATWTHTLAAPWTGQGGELLDHLPCPEPRPKSWPADGQRANGHLRRYAPALRAAAGITVTETKHPRTRRTLWTLSPTPTRPRQHTQQPPQASQPSNPPPTSGDAAKPDPTPGFAPELPGFAPTPTTNPAGPGYEACPPDREASAKPDHQPAPTPEPATDQHEHGPAKAAKPPKPQPPHSSRGDQPCSLCGARIDDTDRAIYGIDDECIDCLTTRHDPAPAGNNRGDHPHDQTGRYVLTTSDIDGWLLLHQPPGDDADSELIAATDTIPDTDPTNAQQWAAQLLTAQPGQQLTSWHPDPDPLDQGSDATPGWVTHTRQPAPTPTP